MLTETAQCLKLSRYMLQIDQKCVTQIPERRWLIAVSTTAHSLKVQNDAVKTIQPEWTSGPGLSSPFQNPRYQKLNYRRGTVYVRKLKSDVVHTGEGEALRRQGCMSRWSLAQKQPGTNERKSMTQTANLGEKLVTTESQHY